MNDTERRRFERAKSKLITARLMAASVAREFSEELGEPVWAAVELLAIAEERAQERVEGA